MGDAVVIGGGVAGIQAALDLARNGVTVHLVEREPSIGGHMAQLDKTFPTNDCSMCILSPKMVEVTAHPGIVLHTCTTVTSIEGEVGNFRVTLSKNPRYIDEEACNGCGDCTLICPVEVYNQFDAGMGVRKAIYRPHAQAVPDIVIKDPDHCIECGLCYDVCGRDAIRKEDSAKEICVDASSIIIATGYETFDPTRRPQLRYLDMPDVVTSLEFERLMNAGGPTGGRVLRLSDGEPPGSVLFIQCVGSRDPAWGWSHCSAVCCMMAIKNAILLKEKDPSMEVTVCYIDIRAFGKGYEEYYQRAIAMGIRFIRGLPAEVGGSPGRMVVQVEDTELGNFETLNPDLVVLSVGIRPSDATRNLAMSLGIPIDSGGFIIPAHEKVAALDTARPGIYLAGTSSGPRDIPDSVAQGGAAAMRAYLDVARN